MRGPLFVFMCLILLIEAELNYPKCCGPDQMLEHHNITCDTFENVTVQITAKEYAGLFNNCSECVDFLVSENSHQLVKVSCNSLDYQILKHEFYPKCCPQGYVYDTIEHKCEYTGEVLSGNSLRPISIGLSTCPAKTHAIADYLIEATVQVEEDQSVSLPNGKRLKNGTYCLDKTLLSKRVLRACEMYRDVCADNINGKSRCLRKCCPDRFIYGEAVGKCSLNVTFGINLNLVKSRVLDENDTDFAIITAPAGSKYLPKEVIQVDKSGYLHLLKDDGERIYSSDEAPYCIETSYRKGTIKQYFFMFIQKQSLAKYYITNVISALSCFFLLLTIVLYCTLPDMLNLFGKSIVSYCAISAAAFGILAIITYSSISNSTACTTFAYLLTFSFLGSFTWLNVICFDMWMAFGTMRVITIGNRRSDLKKLLWYSLYGWGVPIAITSLIAICNYFPFLPEEFIPHLGESKCFLESGTGKYGRALFFSLPTGLCILANVVMFLKTITYYFKVKNDINGMKDTVNSNKDKLRKSLLVDKEKMTMVIKLFLVMGISWIFEIVSSIVDFKKDPLLKYVEIIWDAFNSGQGVFIFFIFTWKKMMQLLINTGIIKRNTSELSKTTSTSVSNLYSCAERNKSDGNVTIADKQL